MIKLKEITKYYYGDSNVTLGLKSINLEFKKGEFIAITGQSGSGKSTLSNVISGMDSYEEGELYFKGLETSYYDEYDWEKYRKNKISFIYQSYNLIDSYTALENVESVIMICENEENKYTRKQRRQKAMAALKKVGLEKQAHNKASHMSSGQKQRLGIARALAKDTDVIIADEPTGNLDVENGKAVMAILHQLAQEGKLVIVVTHNYELAEEYATRKIRLYDGEVVEDIKLDEELYKDNDFQSDFDANEVEDDKEPKKIFHISRKFVSMNRKAQPHRSFFVGIFLLMAAVATIIFYGYFISNIDDTKTKTVSEDVFNNVDDTRLIVRRSDKKPIEESDYETLKSITNVVQVEKYDLANDNFFFYKVNTDYTKDYKSTDKLKYTIVKLEKYNNFIKSSSCLDESDLLAGKMPSNVKEVVLYGDEDLVGEEVEIYLKSDSWKAKYYTGGKYIVSGVLKEETDQIYFNESLALEYSYNWDDYETKLKYTLQDVNVHDDKNIKDTVIDKDKDKDVHITIGADLADDEIRLSNDIIQNLNEEGKRSGTVIAFSYILEDATLSLSTGENETKDFNFKIVKDGINASERIVEVSEKAFFEILGVQESIQMSVYIKDYAYTDSAISEISDAGYEVISALRVSATDYDPDLVGKRLQALLISVAGIIVLFVLEILVIYSLMKLKRADFIILKSLGMKRKMVSQMNYYDLITMTVFMDIIAIIIAIICEMQKVPLITTFMKYFGLGDYLFIIAISILMAVITAFFFNQYMKKRFRVTALRSS